MITTREFFENEADDMITELETFWSVQRDGSSNKKYINIPFPTKEDFFERYEAGLDDPYEELSDIDSISPEEEQQMIQGQMERIAKTYDIVKDIRHKFEKSKQSTFELTETPKSP